MEMNCLVTRVFRGMTDGFFLNIGQPEDTSTLETEFAWEGLYLNELDKPLHDVLEETRCPTLLHYVTVNDKVNVEQVLSSFFDTVDSIPGWKRRIIMMRVAHTETLKDFLAGRYYTFVCSEGNYDYYIHTIWDVLV